MSTATAAVSPASAVVGSGDHVHDTPNIVPTTGVAPPADSVSDTTSDDDDHNDSVSERAYSYVDTDRDYLHIRDHPHLARMFESNLLSPVHQQVIAALPPPPQLNGTPSIGTTAAPPAHLRTLSRSWSASSDSSFHSELTPGGDQHRHTAHDTNPQQGTANSSISREHIIYSDECEACTLPSRVVSPPPPAGRKSIFAFRRKDKLPELAQTHIAMAVTNFAVYAFPPPIEIPMAILTATSPTNGSVVRAARASSTSGDRAVSPATSGEQTRTASGGPVASPAPKTTEKFLVLSSCDCYALCNLLMVSLPFATRRNGR